MGRSLQRQFDQVPYLAELAHNPADLGIGGQCRLARGPRSACAEATNEFVMNDEGLSVPVMPVDRASADFSADRRRLDGTRTFWATSKTEGGVRLTRWNLVGDRWALAAESDAPSWLGAVRNDAELIAVRRDEVTDYQAPDSP